MPKLTQEVENPNRSIANCPKLNIPLSFALFVPFLSHCTEEEAKDLVVT